MSVLFDFDGVIADTSDLIVRYAREASLRVGSPCHPKREDLQALKRMEFSDLGRHLKIPEEEIGSFVEQILVYFREDPKPVPVFEGMPQVLTALSALTPVGIVTGNSHLTVERVLQQQGLTGAVRVVIGLEAGLTKDRKILLAAEKLGDSPQGVYLVGDSASDIVAARKAGARSVAVAWGSQSADKLRGENPDHLVHSPRELLALLSERCRC